MVWVHVSVAGLLARSRDHYVTVPELRLVNSDNVQGPQNTLLMLRNSKECLARGMSLKSKNRMQKRLRGQRCKHCKGLRVCPSCHWLLSCTDSMFLALIKTI